MKEGTKKTAIVTGGSRGIGKAVTTRLAEEKYAVVINYRSNKTEAENLAAEITDNGGEAIAIQADVSKYTELESLFKTAAAHFGQIDVVVNNAGISILGSIAESSEEQLTRLFNTNVLGTVNGMKLGAIWLTKGGSIINFSSTAVATSTPGMGLYAGSKAAVETMSKIFAKELKGKNIRINTIAPGLISSEMFFEGKTQEQIENSAKLSPLQRLGEVEEIAAVVSFLAGKDAGWVNGQLIRVNGGAI